MTLPRIAFSGLAVFVMFAGLPSRHASAAPALATTNVNLRQGPGTTYQVMTTIPGGSTVEVDSCDGEWCLVAFQGQSGYVIATSIDQGGGGAPPPPRAPLPGAPPDAPVAVYPGAPPPAPPPPPGYYGPPVYVAPGPPPYPPPYYGPYPYHYGYYGPYWRGRYYRHW